MWFSSVNALQVLVVLFTFFLEFSHSKSPETQHLIDLYNTQTKKSLLWGPYRPNAYLGIRPRLPRSLLSGLFWFNADDVNNVAKIRHYCDQSLDFKGFGWSKYDPRSGGSQFFKDNEFGIDITTEFVKNDEGNWALRVKGKPRPGFEKKTTSIVFYAGLEGDDGMIVSASGEPTNGFAPGESIKLIGNSKALSNFVIDITDGPSTNKHKRLPKNRIIDPTLNPLNTHYVSLRVPDDNIWKANDIFNVMLQDSIKSLMVTHPDPEYEVDPTSLVLIRDINGFNGNLHFIQKLFTGEFEFDILFNEEDSIEKYDDSNLSNSINSTLDKFDKKFEDVFKLQPPFDKSQRYEVFAKEIFSNLLGGIGYYYGDQLVDRETELDEETYNQIKLKGKPEGPYELFTSSPSRTFFPRGFYWDEGFHLIPILDYDSDLVLEILKSWFNLIDEDGWIAREQILGPEARSKVPVDFQVQSPKIANPPTLMLILVDLLKKAKESKNNDNEGFDVYGDVNEPQKVEKYGDFDLKDITDAHLKYPDLLIDYAEEIYPKLKRHYDWFRKTQKGEISEFEREYSSNEVYRWKGRTFTHCLPSGLDDYPRAPVPDIGELNVDLISWIGIMTRSMKEIAFLLDKEEDGNKYSKIEKNIQKNIEEIHWSPKDKTYCDITVDEIDEDVFVCNKGYISLFPFLLQLIEPGSPHLNDIVKLISDPFELWTNYGIRSLSKQSEFYKTGEDYWRSPVWYPINYLILESLEFYGSGENGALLDKVTKELIGNTYKELRINLVNNCFKNWKETGFVFEQYDDEDGSPRGAKHFTGWTSLVVSIMKKPETLV